jgi:hypothetical protein
LFAGLAKELLAEAYNEDRVRVMLLDISLGGPIGYYRGFPDDPNAVEAVRRWDSGVRVLDFGNAERKDIGEGIYIYFKNTTQRIHGMNAFLTTDPFNEDRVRVILLAISLGTPISYYRGFPNEPHAVEAVRRWDAGVRVLNYENAEIKDIGDGLYVYFKNTNQRIHGMYAFLTNETYNEDRVRYMLLDLSLGGPIDYYRNFPDDPNAVEAVKRWEAGVRVLNSDNTERKDIGEGIYIYFKNTAQRVYGMYAFLGGDVTSVLEPFGLPNNYILNQNYPNPFNPSTTIPFELPMAAKVSIKIYNLNGQEIRTLVDNPYTPGQHLAVWNGQDDHGQQVSSGVYFIHMRAGDFVLVKKALLVR